MRLSELLRGVSNHSNLISLLEIDRKNLVGKTKAQSPDRYNKRLSYHPTSYRGVDMNELLTRDVLVAHVPVGDYVCTVAYAGVLTQLAEVVSKQPRPNVTLQSVIRAITQSIDKTDILVDCTCPDFVYRYAYWATKYGYKYGKPETRPAKITNPDDKIGSMCKHLTALLANKRWLVKLASVVNEFIKANIDDVRSALDLSPDEFIINVPGRPSTKTGRNIGMLNRTTGSIANNTKTDDNELEPAVATTNNITSKINDQDNEDEEELELNIDEEEEEE